MSILDNAQKDSLTQCYTKDLLYPLLEKMSAEFAAYKKPFSILVVDIDGFKKFNDKFGHVFGDEALKYFSSSLRLNLESEDCAIIRFGGDEFVAVFPGRPAKEVYRLATHTENHIRNRPFLFKGREFKFSFSGGIASCPSDGCDIDDLLERADKAMYFSKRHGNGRITQYSRMRHEFLKWFVKIVITFAAIALVLVAAQRIFHINMDLIRDKIISIQKAVAVMRAPRYVNVHLKSGSTIKGIVTEENNDGISLKFSMESGEGMVVIKKSEIQYVDRDYKD
ncbi:MAG: GGDEF domain-containing protein [Candidatus Omnitrophica bacterium]|nr:GGDEF domain-containing protein [Candidatus Omnitrophota bacterium]